MTLLVTGAAGANGTGYGKILAFGDDGKLIGVFGDHPQITDPRGLGIDPTDRLLFVNSGSNRVLALDRNGQVVRATRIVEGLNPGGGNIGPDGRYHVGLRSERTIIAFARKLDGSRAARSEWPSLDLPRREPFGRRSAMKFDPARSSVRAGDFVHQEWPYEPRFKRVNGWRMHYIDEGSGDPVVLLHGNPAWGFLYRKFVKPLTAAGRRVIVPDMIGFGLSEKLVREQAHSLDGHIANLTSLLRQLDIRNATMVCHDWGGPTGLAFALSNPARVRALVIMSTWAWPLPPSEFHRRIFPWRMMHAPLVGPYLLGRHNALAGRGMYLSVVDRKKFRDEAQSVYEGILPDPATRLLTWTWPRWIPLDDAARGFQRFEWLERELKKSKFPTLLVWGREDEVFDHKTFATRFKELLPHAEGPELVTGRHFLQEDSGAVIAEKINDFLGRIDGSKP